jgi:PAS domain-containing protein
LHQTGQRLEELTAGEVDTVADSDGRAFLLQNAQDKLRHFEAARQAAVLNALPANVALIDTHGVIISVNDAWRRFDATNAIQGVGAGIGSNYLQVCDSADGDCAPEAHLAAEGVRSVLNGAALVLVDGDTVGGRQSAGCGRDAFEHYGG